MTAAAPLLTGAGQVRLVARDYPPPGPGQLAVEVHANALCGSDRPLFEHGSTTVAGHEVAGRVARAGADTSIPVGTRGAVFLMSYCGHCRNCRRGATNICLDKGGDIGFNRDGGLGPTVVVEEPMFFPVDDDVPYPLATMLLDVLGTSGHALDRAERVRPDLESVHIAGAGPVGLGLLIAARLRYGPELPIHLSDVSPWRLEFAASLGARPVIADDVGRLPLVDAAFDASGQAPARAAALDRVSRGGVLVCVGHGQDLRLEVSPQLIAAERAVLGSEYFPAADLRRNATLLRGHRELVSQVITHTFDVSELPQAFATFRSGRCGKVVVTQ